MALREYVFGSAMRAMRYINYYVKYGDIEKAGWQAGLRKSREKL